MDTFPTNWLQDSPLFQSYLVDRSGLYQNGTYNIFQLHLGSCLWRPRTEDWGLRTEDWGLRTEDWGLQSSSKMEENFSPVACQPALLSGTCNIGSWQARFKGHRVYICMTSWWVAEDMYYLCTLCKCCVLLCLRHLIGYTGTDNILSHHLCRRL